MGPMKKNLTAPLALAGAAGKRGSVKVHRGKGASEGPMGMLSNPMASSINDYAKATPMAAPMANDNDPLAPA